jgi:collagenase-like PrtC family protease
MRFSVGYPIRADMNDEPLSDMLKPYRRHIAEVYFAWPGEPSGRAPAGGADWDAQACLEENLADIHRMGIRLNLLLNANCYGHRAISMHLERSICTVIDRVTDVAGLDSVTTTSPFAAAVVKERYESIEIRASVNMRVGEIPAMEYLASTFDAFYIQREFNRSLRKIAMLKVWCDSHGKSLHMLANSGCLSFCSTQTFHDNMVAHEAELSETLNAPVEALACRRYLSDPTNRVAVLRGAWIRPEDIHRYEPYFAQVKLATRAHGRSLAVIRAYAEGRYRGNLLDLLEPGHSDALGGCVIDNSRFPEDWFERVTDCSRRCDECSYCESVLREVTTSNDAAVPADVPFDNVK